MTVNDIISRMQENAQKQTIMSLYRAGAGLLLKAPAKSPLFDWSELANAKVLDIDFSISDYLDYKVEVELIIE